MKPNGRGGDGGGLEPLEKARVYTAGTIKLELCVRYTYMYYNAHVYTAYAYMSRRLLVLLVWACIAGIGAGATLLKIAKSPIQLCVLFCVIL